MIQNIGCCVIVLNSDNQVLFGKRRNGYKTGYFGIPGGRVEVGEKLLDTAARELFEETGLKQNNLEYLGVIKENQGEYDFIHFVYLCRQWEGTPTVVEPDKCESWQWVEVAHPPQPILPGHQAALDLFTTKQKILNI